MQEAFNFGNASFWILTADAFARDVAGHFVQIQGYAKSLFAGHLTVAFNLFVQCDCRSHGFSIISFPCIYNSKSLSVTAPSDALVTCAAYFASTPRV